MANTFLTKTFASDSNRKTWTWSAWIKRSGLGGTQTLMTQIDGWNGNGNAGFYIIGDQLTSYNFTSSLNAGTSSYNRPSMFLRDVNGWYHIVVRLDTTQSTASDRCRWYVNGEQLTDFAYANYPSLNQDCNFNGGDPHGIGSHTAGANYFDGVMSYINFSDGYSYAPTVFGSTDSTTGEWTINTNPTFTLGTHGFTILKNGNTITDQSTNSNNWGLGGGTLTKTEDCPDNVFCTMNALSKSLSNVVLSKGNTICRNDDSANGNVLGTIALGNGKYYWETYKHGGGNTGLGITLASVDGSNHSAVHGSRVNYYQDGYIYQNGFGLSDINTGVTYSDTDIISVSVDTEGGTIKFYKNGVLVNNSSQTNSVFTLAQNELIPFWFFSNGGEWRTNFGNGYFGTTTVSSAGTNASGNGIFEYDVQPTDATALSTKGLNL